ncbi:MAG: hypothetical protein ACREMX_17205, partial [Gemmatimonadales bacterium]
LQPLRGRGVGGDIGLLLVGLAVLPQFAGRTLPDTAWLLYAAERWLDGARLYVDLVEVNPPLIIWLNAIPVLVARALAISPLLVYRLLVVALVLGSVLASARLLRRILGPEETALRRYLTLLLLFAALTLARQDFGEREHLMLALTLPYILLTALRGPGGAVSGPVAIGAGLGAAVGIGLKPYFALLWLALELCLRLETGRWRRRPSAESVTVVLAGAAYGLAVARYAPEYFTVVRTMAAPYFAFLGNSLPVTALLGDGALLPLVALCGFLALRSSATPDRRPLWGALFAATLAFYASAVLQQKGWRYHFYPSMATGIVLLGLQAVDLAGPLRSAAARAYAIVAPAVAGAVLVVTALGCVRQALDPLNPRYDADPDVGSLIPVVRESAAGNRVLVLSWSMASAFPLLTYAGAESASRFNHLWIAGAAYKDQLAADAPVRYRDRSEMEPLERFLVDAVVEDFAEARPRLLLVLRPAPDRPEWGLRRLDFLRYFRRDRRFEEVFRQYRYRSEIGQYWIFDRIPQG